MKWEQMRDREGKILYRKATHRNFKFEIITVGGHITVKRWWLDIYRNYDDKLLSACFFKFSDARDFAETLANGEKAPISLLNLTGIYS